MASLMQKPFIVRGRESCRFCWCFRRLSLSEILAICKMRLEWSLTALSLNPIKWLEFDFSGYFIICLDRVWCLLRPKDDIQCQTNWWSAYRYKAIIQICVFFSETEAKPSCVPFAWVCRSQQDYYLLWEKGYQLHGDVAICISHFMAKLKCRNLELQQLESAPKFKTN